MRERCAMLLLLRPRPHIPLAAQYHPLASYPHGLISIPGKYSDLVLAWMGQGKLETISQTLSGCQPCITMLAVENQI